MMPARHPSAILFALCSATLLAGHDRVAGLPRDYAAGQRAAAYTLTEADHALLEEMQRAAFLFFAEQADPKTGLVRDRARADGSPSEGKASIASSGFAFSTWAIAAEREWAPAEVARNRVRDALAFLVEKAPRQHGFFYHFMEMGTGERAWKCEVSSIDTALLIAGAIVAREYFQDATITRHVNRLIADLDWDWFRNDGMLVSLGWHDETGFSRYRWNRFSEHPLMSFLALGASPDPVEAEYWQAWERRPVGRYGPYVYLQAAPLFIHQFPHGYIDFRERRDAFADYYHNSRLATLAQRQFSIDLKDEFPAWGEQLWGVTASDSATGYRAWGGPPRTRDLDGTIVPCAAAGSLPFAPAETLAVLHHIRKVYGDRVWQKYGYVDAFNPQTGWVNSDVIGIDLGISVIQAENLRTGMIWRLFMKAPESQLALDKSGLLSTRRELSTGERERVADLARTAWSRLLQASPEPGLLITALLAAGQLDLAPAAQVASRIEAQLKDPAPAQPGSASRYAAALITVAQALPDLRAAAEKSLASVSWDEPSGSISLTSDVRLAVFLDIAMRRRPADAWASLERTATAMGPVTVLQPVAPDEQLPGLWLDERSVLSGAAASQLAYASISTGAPAGVGIDLLQLDYFPTEWLARSTTFDAARLNGNEAAAFVITAANLLKDDRIRRWFQSDDRVKAARAAIPEFVEAAFGPNTSVVAQGKLAPIQPDLPARSAAAVRNTEPRGAWDWHNVAGEIFRESEADVRAGDPPVSLRFAFTWDDTALYFHAEVVDSLFGYNIPSERTRQVELFVDPVNDGLEWLGAADRQFVFRLGQAARETFNKKPVEATVEETGNGYAVRASIPWSSLELSPQPGLQLGVAPAVLAGGRRDSEPSVKLNWSPPDHRDTRSRLGRLQLQ